MRRLFLTAFAVALPLALAGRAAADDDAKVTITKAIDAHGGKDKLEKFKASKSKGKGVISLFGMDLEFTVETMSQIPDKLKTTIKMEVNGMAFTVEQTVNGDKMSMSLNGMSMEIPDAQKGDLKSAMMQQKILQLTPLLDKGVELKSIPGVKVGDRETVGVSVTGKDVKEVKLYFDKSTHLLAMVERMGTAPMSTDEVKQEIVLSDYKEVQGMKRPTKTVMNNDGKKFMESTVTEQKYLEKLDEKDFSD